MIVLTACWMMLTHFQTLEVTILVNLGPRIIMGNTQPENILPPTVTSFANNLSSTITTESLQGKFTCLEDSEGKKRFLCTVPGCTKRYKNINGIKYHVKNGHNKKENISGEIKKNYLCHCGKGI